PHLTQKLELPFNHFQHFRLLTDIRFETDRRKEALCATALGMALEGLKKPRNPAVNFLKGEFATQSKALTEMWERWRYTATLCAVAFVAFFVYGILRESFMDTAVTRSQEVLSEQAENIAGKKG